MARGGEGRTVEKPERQIEELLRRIEKLEEQRQRDKAHIAGLEEKNRKLERELEEWRRGWRVRDKRTPDRSARRRPSGRKPGRPPGHPGAGRQRPKTIDRIVECPATCADCGVACEPTGVSCCTPVEDLVIKCEVVGYMQQEGRCPRCRKTSWGQLPAALGPAPKLGLQTQSVAMALRHDVGLSFGKLRRALALMGLTVSKGALQQMARRIRERTEQSHREIVERTRASKVLGMDETGWRHEGHKAWAWLARSDEFSLFVIDRSRSHKVVERILGDDFDGILVVDFYGAYEAYKHGRRQYCWGGHLLREARKIAELSPCTETWRFRDRLVGLYDRGLALQRKPDVVADHVLRTSLGRLIADPRLRAHADVARLQNRMDWAFHSLLTFLERRDVPPHNNASEQDIRSLVIFRKTSFCTRSDAGARTLSQLLSIGQTLRKQGHTWLDLLVEALAAYWQGRPPARLFAPRPGGCRGEGRKRTTVPWPKAPSNLLAQSLASSSRRDRHSALLGN
jgi:hypothetical protein